MDKKGQLGFKFPSDKQLMGLGSAKKKKKRETMTPAQRVYIWEHPKLYGRTCSICHQRVTKASDLAFDHTKAHSKGGVKQAIAHRQCNKLKASGSLAKIHKRLGIKTKTKKRKKATKRKPSKPKSFWDVKPPKIKPFKF